MYAHAFFCNTAVTRLVLKMERWNAGTPERRNTKTRNTNLLKSGTHEK